MVCPVCGKKVGDRDSRGRPRKVCSRACALERGRPKYTPLVFACAYCGKSVRRGPAALRRNKSGKVYCNKSCKAKAENTKPRIELTCDFCGEKLARQPSGVYKHNFCSRRCFGLYLRQFTGEQTPNWKGGYNKTERERIRARKQWRELRATILSVFDFRCAACGEFGRTLHIHHIKPWRLGGKDEVENLIPLCAKCHSKQTVRDWEKENQQRWSVGGAHTHRKGGDCYAGEMQRT